MFVVGEGVEFFWFFCEGIVKDMIGGFKEDGFWGFRSCFRDWIGDLFVIGGIVLGVVFYFLEVFCI